MFFENILPAAYLGIGAACALAVLLTAVMFLLKKKSGKVLGLYGLCVALLLGCGFLASNDSPFPQSLINTPEVDYSQSSRGPTPSYIQQIQQQHQPAPENDAPAEDDIGIESIITPEPEPEPEPAPEEADYAEDPPAAVSPTTAKVSSSGTGRNTTKAASGDTSTASKAAAAAATTPAPQPAPLSLDDNPTLAPDPVLAPMPDRELAPDPVLATVSNPTLVDEQYPSYDQQGSSQNDAGSSSGGNSGSSGSSSSDETYMHDFSNGRVLATAASNNNGDPVYHTKDCREAVKISRDNSIWYDSEEAAKNAGRRLCKICGG